MHLTLHIYFFLARPKHGVPGCVYALCHRPELSARSAPQSLPSPSYSLYPGYMVYNFTYLCSLLLSLLPNCVLLGHTQNPQAEGCDLSRVEGINALVPLWPISWRMPDIFISETIGAIRIEGVRAVRTEVFLWCRWHLWNNGGIWARGKLF